MPEVDYVWLPRADLLTFEETVRLVRVFTRVGVDRIRLTGGEPLLRRDLPRLVAKLAGVAGIQDLALTTNGVLLAQHAAALREAGLHRVTVSLDTLDPGRFRALTRFDHLGAVLAGIEAASAAFGSIKIDTVVIRGVNDDEIVPMLAFGRRHHAEVRFIEYMDVAGATRWSWDQVVPAAGILEAVRSVHGVPVPVGDDGSAPAKRYRLADGTVFGIISSTTQPFCRACDRARLTADGHWFRCLYAESGTDLRAPLRAGESDAALEALIDGIWSRRTDRGAEQRLALVGRAAQSPDTADPHQQMHTLGG
jgi:cyclic pyranopterin phosphate synthase